jgi:maleylpyruvate isomerase
VTGRTLTRSCRWLDEGTRLFLAALDGLDDDALGAPTALPGWTRAHVVAHVASNAEAIGNLATWARTGVRTPMYRSPEERTRDIEGGARRPVPNLREWVRRTARDLGTQLASLTPPEWRTEVVTAQGRAVPASEAPWLRAREVMVHAVDLAAGVAMSDLPEDFLVALLDDIAVKRSAGNAPAVVLTDGARTWEVDGPGPVAAVTGRIDDLAGWMSGRPYGGLATADGRAVPELGPWL